MGRLNKEYEGLKIHCASLTQNNLETEAVKSKNIQSLTDRCTTLEEQLKKSLNNHQTEIENINVKHSTEKDIVTYNKDSYAKTLEHRLLTMKKEFDATNEQLHETREENLRLKLNHTTEI